VADEPLKSPGPFDVRTVKSLVALMTQHDLSEIELRDGTQRLRLRRGSQEPLLTTAGTSMPAPSSTTPAQSRADQSSAPAPAASAKNLLDIKSPTVGTYYSSPKPGDPIFVKVGSKVTPDTVVCIIEAMKIFNDIKAECAGTIVEVLVENQQPVEYGQILFKVDPSN